MNDILQNFIADIGQITKQYGNSNDIDKLRLSLYDFAIKYKDYFGIGDYLIGIGEKYADKKDYPAAITVFGTVFDYFPYIANTTALYLRMAECYIENGDIGKGTEFLIRLCTETVDNYEESIEYNDLLHVWLKYKHLVEGKVHPPIRINSVADPITPDECSMKIDEILALDREKILPALAEHLDELSASGECAETLNRWEKAVFYADELCREVASGGFGGYLYYHGHNFKNAARSFKLMGANGVLSVMESVRAKFPRQRIPASQENLQDVLDKMEERGIDFETEDDVYYNSVEKEASEKMLDFVMGNSEKFR